MRRSVIVRRSEDSSVSVALSGTERCVSARAATLGVKECVVSDASQAFACERDGATTHEQLFGSAAGLTAGALVVR